MRFTLTDLPLNLQKQVIAQLEGKPQPPATPKRRTLEAIIKEDHMDAYPEQFSAFLPIKITSEANTREHFRVKAERVAKQRKEVTQHLAHDLASKPKPTRIGLCRISSRLLDSDNLSSGFKHVRDAIAAMLNFDDRDSSVKWTYTEFKRGPHRPVAGFCVTIEWGTIKRCITCGQFLP